MTPPAHLCGEATNRLLIHELLASYANAIDAGDFVTVGNLFAKGCITTSDGAVVAEGAAAVEALYRSTTKLHADGTPKTAHQVTNVVVEFEGDDAATVRSRFTVFQATGRVALQPIVVGRYVDQVVKVDRGWEFRSRMMVPQLWGDTTDHLLFDPTA